MYGWMNGANSDNALSIQTMVTQTMATQKMALSRGGSRDRVLPLWGWWSAFFEFFFENQVSTRVLK